MKQNKIPGLRVHVFKKNSIEYEIFLLYYRPVYKITVTQKNLQLSKLAHIAIPEMGVGQSLTVLSKIPGLEVSVPRRTADGYDVKLCYYAAAQNSTIVYLLLFNISRENVQFYKLIEFKGIEPDLPFVCNRSHPPLILTAVS